MLSSRQKKELDFAVLEYLRDKIDTDTCERLQRQLNISVGENSDVVHDNSKANGSLTTNILEKKWNAVIRLQKKIMELETQVNELSTNDEMIDFGKLQIQATKKKLNWIPSRPAAILQAHKSSVTCVDIHPILAELAVGLGDGTIVVWDMLNHTVPLKVISNAHSKQVNCIRYSRAPVKFVNEPQQPGYVVASCSSDLYVKIWDANDWSLKRTLTGHAHIVSGSVFGVNSGELFSCSRDGNVILWDIVSGWRVKSFTAHSDWVRALDVCQPFDLQQMKKVEGKEIEIDSYVLSCSNDQSGRLSHGKSGTGLVMLIGHNHVIEDIKFAPYSSWKYLDGLVKIKTGKTQESLEDQEEENVHKKLGFKYCATCSRDETIRLWKLPLPVLRAHRDPAPNINPLAECIAELKGHSSWVRSIQFHAGGKYLFSGSDDKSIKVWDLSGAAKLGVVKCIRTLSSGHDGFVNCIKFADPVFDSNAADKIDEEDEEEEETVLNNSIRTMFISGGTDKKVCIWG